MDPLVSVLKIAGAPARSLFKGIVHAKVSRENAQLTIWSWERV